MNIAEKDEYMIALNRQNPSNASSNVAFGTNLDKSIAKTITDIYKWNNQAIPESLISKAAQLKNDGFDKLCLTIEKGRVKGDPRKIYDILKAFNKKSPNKKLHLFQVTGGEPKKFEDKFLKLDAAEIQSNIDEMIQKKAEKGTAISISNQEKLSSFARFASLFR